MLDLTRNGSVIYLQTRRRPWARWTPSGSPTRPFAWRPTCGSTWSRLARARTPKALARLTRRGGLSVRAHHARQTRSRRRAPRRARHAARASRRARRPRHRRLHPLPAVQEQWVSGEPLRVFAEITGALPRTVTIEARDSTRPSLEHERRRRRGARAGRPAQAWGLAALARCKKGLARSARRPRRALRARHPHERACAGASSADGAGGYAVGSPLDDALRTSLCRGFGRAARSSPAASPRCTPTKKRHLRRRRERRPRHEIGETGRYRDKCLGGDRARRPSGRACINRARACCAACALGHGRDHRARRRAGAHHQRHAGVQLARRRGGRGLRAPRGLWAHAPRARHARRAAPAKCAAPSTSR